MSKNSFGKKSHLGINSFEKKKKKKKKKSHLGINSFEKKKLKGKMDVKIGAFRQNAIFST